MDVTNLAFRRSLVANEHSIKLFKVILASNADATEKLDLIVFGSSERDTFDHIPPYLASHVHDRDSYSSIDAEVNAEIARCLSLYSDLFVGI